VKIEEELADKPRVTRYVQDDVIALTQTREKVLKAFMNCVFTLGLDIEYIMAWLEKRLYCFYPEVKRKAKREIVKVKAFWNDYKGE